MPLLHFNGQFSFQSPFYNNNPRNDARKKDPINLDHPKEKDPMHFVKFESTLSTEQLQKRIGCDPLRYFDFEFLNVHVSRITYDDGTLTDKDDLIIGKPILLKGLLVDVDPHLERGQLFAAEVRVVDALIGQLNKAVQSDLHTSIRNGDNGGSIIYSASFETELYNVYHLIDPKVSEKNSRYISELLPLLDNLKKLEMHFRIDRYDASTNKGDIYGYIGPALPETDNGILIKNRLLIMDSAIDDNIKADFHIDENDRMMHIQGSYDIVKKGYILLRYLDFIPFIDMDYNTPSGYRFHVVISTENSSNIAKDPLVSQILDSSHEEMRKSGGLAVIKLPIETANYDDLNLSIKVTNDGIVPKPFLAESRWNIVLTSSYRKLNSAASENVILKDSQECITMGSNQQRCIELTVYYDHHLCPDDTEIGLKSPDQDDRSPIVAWFTKSAAKTRNGCATTAIQARNLEDSDDVKDPLSDSDNQLIRGFLPWDRYYGNKLTLTTGSNDLFAVEINIAVRVLHVIDETKIPANINFARDILPLFSYYLRYYPWLHTDVESCRYNQFLNLENPDDVLGSIGEILGRIRLDDNNRLKMPRSRDFPIGGERLLERLECIKSTDRTCGEKKT